MTVHFIILGDVSNYQCQCIITLLLLHSLMIYEAFFLFDVFSQLSASRNRHQLTVYFM